MLKITGNSGKSLIVEAIQKRYDDSRVYSYNDYMVPTMESYHVDSDECTVDEFCKFVYQDISGLEGWVAPVNIVVIYTNLRDVKEIEDLAAKLESEYLVRMVIITSR